MAQEEKNWERETLEKLAFSALKEQIKSRRWGIFFKLLTFAYITFLVVMVFEWRGDGEFIADGKHTALIELDGVIEAKGDASAEKITDALQSAFKDKNTQGVILRINSPAAARCNRASSTTRCGGCAASIRTRRCMWWWRTSVPRAAISSRLG